MGTTSTPQRVRTALGERRNWLQLVKFGTVGASGFVVNFLVFGVVHGILGVHYLPSAVAAFCVAVANNFAWNRLWTFRRNRGHSPAHFQLARFVTVSISALVPNLLLLRLFVETVGLDPYPAQVIAVCLVTPISFLGNKLWSFR